MNPDRAAPERADLRLAIIVVSYNSQDTIAACLESLTRYAPVAAHRVIVVDNASSDATVSIVREKFPQVVLIANGENTGFGTGNNIGFAEVAADYYYCHNADAYLQAPILDECLATLDSCPEIGIAGLPLVYPDLSPQTAAYAASTPGKWLLQGLGVAAAARWLVNRMGDGLATRLLGRLPLARTFVKTHAGGAARPDGERMSDVDWVCGAALILRGAALRSQPHGFDPEIFLYGEDEELCLRLARSGWRIVQLATTPVIHDFGWGKSVRSSRRVVDLKYQGLRVFVAKTFAGRTFARSLMRGLLELKYLAWKFQAAKK